MGQEKGRKKAKSTRPAKRLKWYAKHRAMVEKSRFRIPEWQFIGPTNVSGRVTDVAVVTPKGKSYTMYAARWDLTQRVEQKNVEEGVTEEPKEEPPKELVEPGTYFIKIKARKAKAAGEIIVQK